MSKIIENKLEGEQAAHKGGKQTNLIKINIPFNTHQFHYIRLLTISTKKSTVQFLTFYNLQSITY